MKRNESAVEVWQRAGDHTEDLEHPAEVAHQALLPALERFFVSPGSSCGIEQLASLFKRVMGEQWYGEENDEEPHLVLTRKARREQLL